MNELIEKLKDKTYVRAFGLMSQAEQEVFKKVREKNCLCYCSDEWGAKINWRERPYHQFSEGLTYSIKPDYQPEPEYVDLEIELNTGYLGVHVTRAISQVIPHPFWLHLHCLPSLPNFEGFWLNVASIAIENIAREVSQGYKVFARFRRDI